MKWFILGIKNYCKFDGRASRAEFWWYFLFYILFYFFIFCLDSDFAYQQTYSGYRLFRSCYLIFMALPTIGIQVRRLHDVGKSGWWLLLFVIPLLGICLYYFFVKKGDPFINKYGAPSNHNIFVDPDTDACGNSNTASSSNTYNTDQQTDFPQVMFCRKCGTQMNTSASFCHKCGTQVIKSDDHPESTNNDSPQAQYNPPK